MYEKLPRSFQLIAQFSLNQKAPTTKIPTLSEVKENEAPRSKAAGVSHDSMIHMVTLGMPCPSRSRAAGHNDKDHEMAEKRYKQ